LYFCPQKIGDKKILFSNFKNSILKKTHLEKCPFKKKVKMLKNTILSKIVPKTENSDAKIFQYT